MNLRHVVKQRALEAGFDLAGIAPLSLWKDLEFSRRWVEQGYGGEMRYLRNPKRNDPGQVSPSARSVLCVGLIYNAPLPYSTECVEEKSEVRSQKSEEEQGEQKRVRVSDQTTPRAWISRYAWGRDYHDEMRNRLEQLRAAIEAAAPGVETRVYVDTGPVNERTFARYSGIGWMGKNTCIINQQKGSWFFLGVILTSLELEPDLPAPDRCGTCTRCIEACPTGALVEPYVMNASRCIAYFNIELKGSIPVEFRPAIGHNVFGCDICQDVCPWNAEGRRHKTGVRSQEIEVALEGRNNAAQGVSPEDEAGPKVKHVALSRLAVEGPVARGVATTTLPEFQPMQLTLEPRIPNPGSQKPSSELRTFSLCNPRLEDLASLTEEDFRKFFARSPLKRTKYRGWLRNLCVAMGNSGDRRFVPKLEELSEHPDPVVREHAEWALERVRP